MKIFLVLFLFYFGVFSLPSELTKQQFGDFKKRFSKNYSNPVEEQKRLKIFSENLENIEKHNDNYRKGLSLYQLGIQKYSDLTIEEFLQKRTGLVANFKRQINPISTTRSTTKSTIKSTTKSIIRTTTKTTSKSTTRSTTKATIRTTTKTTSKSTTRSTTKFTTKITTLPTALVQLDWRTRGFVSEVKDQEECGCCWAFSATGSLEGQWYKKTGKLPNLSEQNLVDCSKSYGNNGCAGGIMQYAFSYVKNNKGINSQLFYPYEAADAYSCRYDPTDVSAQVTGYKNIPFKDEVSLEKAVREIGPISAAVYASYDFANYKSGVLTSKACNNTTLNHAVLITGYNNTNTPPYWLVKNSWGTAWGEQGYIRIEKGKNTCNIANLASYPLV